MTFVTMSTKEIDRLTIITKLINKQIDGPEAAEQLLLTTRQVRRLKRRVKKHGAEGLAHRGRGVTSNRKLQQTFIDKIISLLRTTYVGYGPTLAAEKLFERDKIKISTDKLKLQTAA